jgi:putative flippase GtrA
MTGYEMISKIYRKYKGVIGYVFFGGLTTMVNLAAYYILTRLIGTAILLGTFLAWCIAVGFAYITNRKLVFRSRNKAVKAVLLELTFFIVCRLLTGLLDLGIMYFFVYKIRFPDLPIKLLSNILVILGNYIASSLCIFGKHDAGRQAKSE